MSNFKYYAGKTILDAEALFAESDNNWKYVGKEPVTLQTAFDIHQLMVRVAEEALVPDDLTLPDCREEINKKDAMDVVVKLAALSGILSHARLQARREGWTIAIYAIGDGMAKVTLTRQVNYEPGVWFPLDPRKDEHVLSFSGKVTRVLTKCFGEQAVTAACKDIPLKGTDIKVLLTKKDFGAHYDMLSQTESVRSCMNTFENDEYLAPYETGLNTFLLLLWDTTKGRPVARGVAGLNLAEPYGLHVACMYGNTQAKKALEESEVVKSNTCGLYLGLHEAGPERYHFPYVDGHSELTSIVQEEATGDKYMFCGSHLDEGFVYISENYVYNLDQKCTFSEDSLATCDCCGEVTSSELIEVYGGDMVCEGCVDYVYRWSELENSYIHEHNVVYSDYEGDYLHEDDAAYCEITEEYMLADSLVELVYVIENGGQIHLLVHPDVSECDVRAYGDHHIRDYVLKVYVDDELVIDNEPEEEEDAA